MTLVLTITMDDESGKAKVTVADSAGSTVTFNSPGRSIALSAEGDVTVEVDGDTAEDNAGDGSLRLDAVGDLSITAGRRLDLNAVGPITISAPIVNVT